MGGVDEKSRREQLVVVLVMMDKARHGRTCEGCEAQW